MVVRARREATAEFAYTPQQQALATGAFCADRMMHGAFMAAFGPALGQLARNTGGSVEALGLAVAANKTAKLAATVSFMVYGDWVKNQRGTDVPFALQPNVIMGISCMLIAAAAALVPLCTSVLSVTLVLIFGGFAYGFGDCGCYVFLVWIWQDKPQRAQAATSLCAGLYTLGAIAAPLLVAASISYSGDILGAYSSIALCGAAIGVALISVPSAPPPPEPSAQPDQKSGGMIASDELARMLQLFAGGFLFLMVGFEHTLGTWLSTYASQRHGLAEASAAVLTSSYWTAMTVGRGIYTLAAAAGVSNWTVVFGSMTLCAGSSLFFVLLHSQGALWAGAIGAGLGVSAVYACGMTLPASHGIFLTPRQTTTVMLMASAGEVVMPWSAGEAQRLYGPDGLAWILVGTCTVALAASLVVYRRTLSFKPKAE